MEADPPAKPGAIAGGAVSPADAAIARREMKPTLRGRARPVDKGADDARMQASVDKTSLRAQAPSYLAAHRGEVLQVGME